VPTVFFGYVLIVRIYVDAFELLHVCIVIIVHVWMTETEGSLPVKEFAAQTRAQQQI